MERFDNARARAHVKELRRLGSWVGIELCDPRTGETLAQGLGGRYEIARDITRLLLERGCAAARASEGILHVSPPYVSTESDLDYVVERVSLVLDDLESVILRQAEW
jgi:adenosylmethionine-8-amino-7-oxononanoate aminotransferase